MLLLQYWFIADIFFPCQIVICSTGDSWHTNWFSSHEQIAADGDDSDSSDDDDGDAPMMEDEAAAAVPEQMAVDRPRPSRPAPDADGWTVVPPRHGGRSRGNN